MIPVLDRDEPIITSMLESDDVRMTIGLYHLYSDAGNRETVRSRLRKAMHKDCKGPVSVHNGYFHAITCPAIRYLELTTVELHDLAPETNPAMCCLCLWPTAFLDKKLALGDRMKFYESKTESRLDPKLPIMMRMDGRHFHSFCKGLKRPFDDMMTECMRNTTSILVEEANAVLGYTQSDEITLVILPTENPLFGGRVQKLCSSFAALASVVFLVNVTLLLPQRYWLKRPTFDCRVWNVPSLEEAANAVLWRELDAEKNSVSALAQSNFSHQNLHGVVGEEKKKMLAAIDRPWEALPVKFQRGSYFKRVTRVGTFSEAEIESLPPKHTARKDPDATYERSAVEAVEFPRLIDTHDKVAMLFNSN
jgi:tRNA(His) 5'-end guanylyltransferase